MALEPRVKAIAGCLASGALLLAAIILLIAASGGALPIRAQEAPDSYSGASSFSDAPALVSKPHPPQTTDINDCSQWAANVTGFNPGSSKTPPLWRQPKPSSGSGRARYDSWVGACLGQR